MNRFKSRTSYSLRKRGPSGKIYIFVRDKSTAPDCKMDAEWMERMCTVENGALLMSESQAKIEGDILPNSRMTMKDLLPEYKKEEPKPIVVGKNEEQKAAELSLAKDEETKLKLPEESELMKAYHEFLQNQTGKCKVDDLPDRIKDEFSKKELIEIGIEVGIAKDVIKEGNKTALSTAIISTEFIKG